MPSRYEQGRDAEYRAQRELEAEGYETNRFAGSHGKGDVIAWDATITRFIQVKTYRKKPDSYARDIAALAQMQLPPEATAELWVRRVGQQGWQDQLVIQHTLEANPWQPATSGSAPTSTDAYTPSPADPYPKPAASS